MNEDVNIFNYPLIISNNQSHSQEQFADFEDARIHEEHTAKETQEAIEVRR